MKYNKASKQLLKAMRADPVLWDLVCQQVEAQQKRKPQGPDDLRRIVMAKAAERVNQSKGADHASAPSSEVQEVARGLPTVRGDDQSR